MKFEPCEAPRFIKVLKGVFGIPIPDGGTDKRELELVVKDKTVIGILVLNEDHSRILTVSQFRPGPVYNNDPAVIIEACAGHIEQMQSVEQAAICELSDELSIRVTEDMVRRLGQPYYSSPGMTSEKVQLAMVTIPEVMVDTTKIHGNHEEGEYIQAKWLTAEQVDSISGDPKLEVALYRANRLGLISGPVVK